MIARLTTLVDAVPELTKKRLEPFVGAIMRKLLVLGYGVLKSGSPSMLALQLDFKDGTSQ